MAIDYFKAKQAGYSDEEIAQYIAQEKNVDYAAAIQAGYKPLEIIGGLDYGINVDKPITDWDAFTRGLERGITGTTRGVGQVMTKVSGLERQAPAEDIQYDPMGNVISGGTAPSVQEVRTGVNVEQADKQKELEYEIAKAQGSKAASYGGYIAGTLLDPANIITGLGQATVKSLATEGLIAGGVQGFFDPVYETEDTWGNRAVGAGMGAVTGGALGAGAGKLLKKFGFIEKDTPSVKADEVPEMSTKGAEDAINEPIIPKQEATVETPVVETPVAAADLTPPPLATPPIAPMANAVDPYTATLPAGLSKAAPRYGRDVVGFNSDLDRALYIIRDSNGNRSKADAAYLNWVKKVTGIDDEATLRGLGDDVLAHLKATPDVGNIPPSNLAALRPQQAAPQAIPVPEIVKPTAPYQGSAGINLGNVIDPASNAWKVLDNPSKNLYNIGRRLLESDITGGKIKLTPVERMEAESFIKGIDPTLNELQRGEVVRSYAKVLDDLYSTKGADFQPPSLAKLMKQGIDEADMAELMAKGVFDGCDL